MRVFQNFGLYPAYHDRLRQLATTRTTFEEYKKTLLRDRYGACHLLLPVDQGEPDAFFTSADHVPLQKKWARENGMPRKSSLKQILLAQIEHHRTEVFYNLDPVSFGSEFISKLPGSVKKKIAWRAAPSPNSDFSAYSLIVCNFPSILESYNNKGLRTAYFSPAHDPIMDKYAENKDRPIDLLFVGGYTRHHARRAALLEAVADLSSDLEIAMHLDCSRMTRLAESSIGKILPMMNKQRRPDNIQKVSKPPLFGIDLYTALSKSKIVLNGAIDMAGTDRGNMRCFEALGTGSLLISDAGTYPTGMQDKETLITYTGIEDALTKIRTLLSEKNTCLRVASAGHSMVRSQYSKISQWNAFRALVA